MKRTSKLLVLLAAIGMLVGCSGKNKNSGGNSGGKDGGGGGGSGEVTENLLNVIYFNTYVSDSRASEIKNGLVSALETAGEDVDASKINFFKSRNSKVAGLGEEILDYNDENPKNTVDVLLGANNFTAWDDEELKPLFEAKYENDGNDYTYGTHSTLSNNTNRKFFYDKEKANDKYVKALQTYLQENWMGGGEEPPVVETSALTVAVYGTFVSVERMGEIHDGFVSYLTAQNVEIEDLVFIRDAESTSIADFIKYVQKYDTEHPTAKVDALLGLKTNAAITEAGYSQPDKTEYTYGDSGNDADDRRLWVDPSSANSANLKHLENYLKASWVPAPVVENKYYLTGSFNEWATTGLTQELLKVEDKHYRISNVEFAANDKFKVYSPEEDKYYSNDSTWTDCGFTLDESKNIVISATGTYTVDLYLDATNNNFVTLEKQAAPKTIFTIGIYDKFVDVTRAAALKAGVETYFAAHEINADVLTPSLGTGNTSKCAEAVTAYNGEHADNKIDVILGLKQDNGNAIADIGYEIGSVNYTYGNAGGADNDRKITVLPASTTRAEFAAFVEYMNANWLYVPEPDYYLIGSFSEWNVATLDYKLTKVETGTYKYENLQLSAGAAFKVFIPGDEPTYFTNADTWTDCGFTLGENGNIVVTLGGFYTVNFYVEGQNGNHVTIEKTAELPAANYYLVGSFNEWNQEDTTYPLSFVSEGVFKYEAMSFTAGAEFKVLKVEGTLKTLITNASTWANCGFTLGEYNNIVVTEAGKYDVVYNVNGENNNFVTIDKLPEVTYTIAVYTKFVNGDRADAIETAFNAYVTANNIAIDRVVFAKLGEGNEDVGPFVDLINDYNEANPTATVDAIIGAKAGSAISGAGFERLGSAEYTYGTKSGFENDRRLWCKSGQSNSVGAQALLAYMNANWAKPAA